MRTKASFKGHPVHQMLIPFPIAFFTGALIFDSAGLIFNDASLSTTGAYLVAAGIFTALAAAIPGFIDFLFTVPPKSSGKQRALKHMIVNLSAVAIFSAAFIMRLPFTLQPGAGIIILEAAGVILLLAGGWLGGTLVNRNFIGPDHRYADAGKWKEITVSSETGTPVKIAGINELKVNQMKLIHYNGKRIVLARTENGYYAFNDSCSHKGGSLAGGVLICGKVHCLWHGSQFDVKTGQVECGPAREKISTFIITENKDGIYLSAS